MCGIYGVVSPAGAPLRDPQALERMGRTLRHRGPDGCGNLTLPHASLGVNRLRIVDLGPRADQPFADAASCVWVAVNGEIYNAPELRRQFADYPFRSRSDAETVLPLYLARGPQGIAELDGMFAIAIWDERSRTLVLARDRAGEKPLFYAACKGEVRFGSEIEALLEHPDVGRSLDLTALGDFLKLGYPLEPRTLFAQVRKVEAGTIAVFHAAGQETIRYWDPATLGMQSGEVGMGKSTDGRSTPHSPFPIPPSGVAAAEQELAWLLESAVTKQLAADVPVGVFTSGGLDSSLITAIAARATPAPLQTFTVRFAEGSYDEGDHARRLARLLGTRHTDVTADYAALARALEVVSGLAEPITDPAILPTFLLAEAARERVGAVLTGEGADELFGGYPTYLGHKLALPFGRLPRAVRRVARLLVEKLPSSPAKVPVEALLKRFVAEAEKPWVERHTAWFGTGLPGDVLLDSGNGREDGWTDGWMALSRTQPSAHPLASLSTDVLGQAMLLDYQTYLRDNLLPKVDRATMLVALEARAPYLDRDLATFALRLPSNYKVRRLTTKWILKRVAARQLPKVFVRRRKRGLSVPLGNWMNGALRPEVDRLLAPERLRRQGLLNAQRVDQLLREHRAGRFGHARGIWTLFVLERWLERWM